jgi:hypothetical protein
MTGRMIATLGLALAMTTGLGGTGFAEAGCEARFTNWTAPVFSASVGQEVARIRSSGRDSLARRAQRYERVLRREDISSYERAWLNNEYAKALNASGEVEQAVTAWSHALDGYLLGPDITAQVVISSARGDVALGRYDAAWATLENLICNQVPRSGAVATLAARILLARGMFEEAEAYAQGVLNSEYWESRPSTTEVKLIIISRLRRGQMNAVEELLPEIFARSRRNGVLLTGLSLETLSPQMQTELAHFLRPEPNAIPSMTVSSSLRSARAEFQFDIEPGGSVTNIILTRGDDARFSAVCLRELRDWVYLPEEVAALEDSTTGRRIEFTFRSQ